MSDDIGGSDPDGDPRSESDREPPDEEEKRSLLSGMSDPIRMEILLVLVEATEADDVPLTFSELRERVGERDSGKFNHHLSELTGTIVERTGEGYRIQPQYVHSNHEKGDGPEPDLDDLDPAALAGAGELLAHDLRRRIVEELGEHRERNPESPTLQFGDLRERVEEGDPGKFNYHLRKLVGEFVERIDDGYRLLDDPGPEGFRWNPDFPDDD